MSEYQTRQRCASLILAALFACGTTLPAAEPAEDEVDLSKYFGFKAIEIYKLENRSADVNPGDFNADGKTDLAIVDNSHSRIDLLLQRTEEADPKDSTPARGVNQIESHKRLVHKKVGVDREVHALAVGDVNGDGKTDLVYFANPDRLIVRYQQDGEDWSKQTEFRLADVSGAAGIVAVNDLNGDGKHDVAVLGKYQTYLLYQKNGQLAPPESLMNTSETLQNLRISDLDGDGRNDLCASATEGQERVLCARLQDKSGKLGPEFLFQLRQPRAITISNLDGKPGEEVMTIDTRTGRLQILKLKQPEGKPGELSSRLIQYGFGRQGSGRDRDIATGDVNGDGLTDVVVTDPEVAQTIVFQQQTGHGLDMGTAFPSFLGCGPVRVADFDKDGSGEVIVLSTNEQTLGYSKFKDEALAFPQPITTAKEPLAIDLADLDEDGVPEVVYVGKERGSKSTDYTLHALTFSDGEWKEHSFGDSKEVKLGLRAAPERILSLDANGDRRSDFLVFFGLDRAPQLFVTNDKGIPTENKQQGGIQLGNVAAGAVFVNEGEEPGLLLAQKSFGRNLQLDESGNWRVKEQYNAPESSARIVGTAMLDLDGSAGREVVLVDSGIGRLRILRQEENVYRPWREVEIGSFPFIAVQVADLNNDKRDDLLLFGKGKFAVLYAGRIDPQLEEVASFETKLEDAFLSDVAAGDLNQDGFADAVLIDTRSHNVEILDYGPQEQLKHGMNFKIFEEKSFSGPEGGDAEPREVLTADVDADGRTDLILLAHDRVLVYLQDDGKAETPGEQASR